MCPIAGGRVWSPDNFRPSIYFTLVYWKNAVLTTLLSIFTFIINWLWLNFISIDVSILSETSDQFENSLCVLSNITNQASANQSSTLMASYRQLKNTACDNFWMNCFKLISESDEALEQFVTCLSNFSVSQKASKKKNQIVHSILKLLLPNLFGKDREDILVDVQCLLTLSNPQDLLVRIRQLIKCPFIKSSILPSRLELEKANSRLNDDFRSILWTVENRKWISCQSGQVRQVRCWKYL